MISPPTGNESGLVSYWNFNEGNGNTVTDLTSNGNDGTINGATWSTDAPAQYANNCTATDDIVVTVNPLPTIDLGADTTLICAGTSETLDAGTGFASYLWSDGSTNQTLLATSAGTYTVSGTDVNGCIASDSMVIDVLTVDIAQNDTTICEGDTLVLLANASQNYYSLKLTDIDGNIYNTTLIGNQEWMTQNLRTNSYSNGDPIDLVTDNTVWSNLSTGAYCWYDNDSISYDHLYGKLYNYYAKEDSRNLCPTGWNIPSNADWDSLINYLGSIGYTSQEGKALKSTYGWTTNGDDIFGFNALPGGYRLGSGSFGFRNVFFDVWSVEGWKQFSDNDNIGEQSGHQDHGFAKMCEKFKSSI